MLKTHKLMQEEVRELINEFEHEKHLSIPAQQFSVNPLIALRQVRTKAKLEILYEVLGEVCPTYPFERKPEPKAPIEPLSGYSGMPGKPHE